MRTATNRQKQTDRDVENKNGHRQRETDRDVENENSQKTQ